MVTQLTKSFSLEEFTCGDGTAIPAEFLTNVKILAENLQVLRDYIGVPILITSGYRTALYNKKVSGKTQSQHLTASAADISTKKHSPRQLHSIIEKLIKDKRMKQGGLGLYRSFVHYDIRGRRSRWYEL